MSDIERTFAPSETGQLSDSLIGTVLSPDDFVYVATTGGIDMRRKSDLELVKRITHFLGRDGYDYGAVADVVSMAVDHNYVWVSCKLDSVAVIVRLRWSGLTVKDVWTLPQTVAAPKIAVDRTRIVRAYGDPENYGLFLHSKLPPFRLLAHDSGFTAGVGDHVSIKLGQGTCYDIRELEIEIRSIPNLLLQKAVTSEEEEGIAVALDADVVYVMATALGHCIIDVYDRSNLNWLVSKNFHGAMFTNLVDLTVDDGYFYAAGTYNSAPAVLKAVAYENPPTYFGDDEVDVVLSEAPVAIACIPPMYYTEFINEGQGGEAVVRMQFPQPWSERKTRLPVNPVARLALRVQATFLGAIVPLLKPVVTLALRVSASGYLFRPMAPVARLAMRVLAEAEYTIQKTEVTLAFRVSAERVDDSTS